MNRTSCPNHHDTAHNAAFVRATLNRQEAQIAGHSRGSPHLRWVTVVALTLVVIFAALCTGCASVADRRSECRPASEVLSSSDASALIAVIPRTSANAASWGLRELAFLLPFVAHTGLELHVIYTQDSDDLVEGGGDGGPPQILEAEVPSFPTFQVRGVPRAPTDPTALTEKLYCEHLAVWQSSAHQTIRHEVALRASVVRAWATSTAARLTELANRPIPDTTGPEAGVEFDAGASIFDAAQVAQAVPRPTIVILGELTELTPPSQRFQVLAHLVVLVRSTNPDQVLHAESAWSRWVKRAGGSFQALSANDTPAVIASALLARTKAYQGEIKNASA